MSHRQTSAIIPALRWALARALGVEVVLALLVAAFGFGGPIFDPPWYSQVLPATQLPGILLLERLGFCCGYMNGLVLSDEMIGRWGGLTTVGAPILFAANTAVLAMLLWAGRLGWRLLRPRRDAPGAAAV